jgi:hypothetical protein
VVLTLKTLIQMKIQKKTGESFSRSLAYKKGLKSVHQSVLKRRGL